MHRLWLLPSALVLLGMFSLPSLAGQRLADVRERWRQEALAGRPFGRASRLAGQAWVLATAAAMMGIGASYLYLVAHHCGLIAR